MSDNIKTLKEYSDNARKTAHFSNQGKNLRYCLDGLASEVGEIFGHVKRIDRDDNSSIENMSPERREALLKELGDCLWYLAMCAEQLDSDLEQVAQMNIDKLRSRAARNAIKGEGDDR